jgi:hypothetical protein
VGDQVVAFKQREKEYYYARIVDTAAAANSNLIFVHYEGWPPDQATWINSSFIIQSQVQTAATVLYGPKGKESKISWQDYKTFYYSNTTKKDTGLVSDTQMNLHECPCKSHKIIHPERPDRISCILDLLHSKR